MRSSKMAVHRTPSVVTGERWHSWYPTEPFLLLPRARHQDEFGTDFSRIPQRFHSAQDPAGREGRAFLRSRSVQTTAGRILPPRLDYQEAPSTAATAQSLVQKFGRMHGSQNSSQGSS